MNHRRLLLSLFSFAVLASTVGVAGLGASSASASNPKTVRTIHRVSHLGPLRARSGANAAAGGLSLARIREISAQHIRKEGEGSNATPSVKPTKPTKVAAPNAPAALQVQTSFSGLNALDSFSGNNFDLEPPDQGMCVGGGKVLEVLNDVLTVYDSKGTSLTNPVDLNTFYGYPPAFDPSTGVSGPFMTDPTCTYDSGTGRWYVSELTIETDPKTGHFLGTNHIDLAVSATADPAGSWNVYQIPVQDDGTQGTPNHQCVPDPSMIPPEATNPNACFGDYPKIGLDGNGLYITTNEYPTFGPLTGNFGFHGAQIYAMPKAALATGSASIPLVQIDTAGMVRGGQPGFTLIPAAAPQGAWSGEAGGTLYFLSSNATGEVGATNSSSDLVVWALDHTSSLDTNQSVRLRHRVLTVNTYAVPPRQNQPPGDLPVRDCVNDTTVQTQAGPGCWRLFGLSAEPPHNQQEGHPDGSDSRIMTAWYQGGLLYGALDTAARIVQPGQTRTEVGVEWFVVRASNSSSRMRLKVANQGVLAVAGNNVSYPAIAVTEKGTGVMGMTLMGDKYFPSAAWTSFGLSGPGKVHVVATGVGPYDGFGAYPPLFGGSDEITRWGDYAAATVSGSSLWIANEWVGQTCTFQDWLNDPSCGGTRSPLENWDTRITRLTPTR